MKSLSEERNVLRFKCRIPESLIGLFIGAQHENTRKVLKRPLMRLAEGPIERGFSVTLCEELALPSHRP